MGEATVCMIELIGSYIAVTSKDDAEVTEKIADACEAIKQASRGAFSIKTEKTK